MKHKHHIIPKHMGGSNDSSNIIELTVEEHAEAHRVLYEEHGLLEDFLAWKGLSGQIDKEEILKEIYTQNAKNMVKKRTENGIWQPWNKGKKGVYREETLEKMRKPKSEETKEKMRKPKSNTDKMKKPKNEEHKNKIRKNNINRAKDPAYKAKLSASQKASRRSCIFCGMESNKANVTRHEKKCKSNPIINLE